MLRKKSESTCPSELINQIRSSATDRLDIRADSELRRTRSIINPYSTIHILESKDPNFRIYVKCPKSENFGDPVLQQRLNAEFEIMSALSQSYNNSEKYSVTPPIGVYPEYPAIATLDAGSTSLRDHYSKWGRLVSLQKNRDHLEYEVKCCAEWLRDFQRKTSRGSGEFNSSELLHYTTQRLNTLQNIGAINSWETQSIIANITLHSKSIKDPENAITGRHNDYASHNIMARDGSVCVIDFSMYDTGSFAFDPVNFWLELEILKCDSSYNKRFLQHLQKTFLETYDLIELDSPIFNLVRCQYTANRLLTNLTTKRSLTNSNYIKKVTAVCKQWLTTFGTHKV